MDLFDQRPVWERLNEATCSVASNAVTNWSAVITQCTGQLQAVRVSPAAPRSTGQVVQQQCSSGWHPDRCRTRTRISVPNTLCPAFASISWGLWAARYSGREASSSSSSSHVAPDSSEQQHSSSSSPDTSSSSGSSQEVSRPQPLGDVAMSREEVRARLSPISVYTVANPKKEFVLLQGENDTQLGFFFFNKGDAEAIIDKIREENPRLARDSKVLKVSMDNVYEVFTTPRDQTGLTGIHFRFMPDMNQVQHALQLYKEAGVPSDVFIGVPVFQAEGLTVTTQDMQYVPLFLSKEDLDVAVAGAYQARNAAQISAVRAKAADHEAAYQEALKKADAASGRDKASCEAKAAKAKAALDVAVGKVVAIEQAPLPKIEVGSFEEVLVRMSASEGSELAAWSQVMFVAPGLLAGAADTDANSTLSAPKTTYK